jgi:translation initiation factor 4A
LLQAIDPKSLHT